MVLLENLVADSEVVGHCLAPPGQAPKIQCNVINSLEECKSIPLSCYVGVFTSMSMTEI